MKAGASVRMVAWVVAVALVATPVVGVLAGWFASDRWPVRELAVHATFEHVDAAKVRAAVQPELGAGFFALRLDQVRDAVAALPWVARATVSKRWPDALDITIQEIQPVAHWGSDALLGRDGRVFQVPGAAQVGGLPWLSGPDGRVADVVAFYRTASRDFALHGLEVAQVELSARNSWTLRLSDGGRVVVGDEHPTERLARFVATLPILMRGRQTGFTYADLRYSNGFAVRWPEPASATSPNPTNGVPHAPDRHA